MRFLLITTLVLGAALVACGEDSKPDSDDFVPIMHVMTYIQNQPPAQVEPRGAVILEEGEHDCLIPSTGNAYLPGTCEWVVEQGNGNWGVTYIETWKCADYHAVIGAEAYCPDETAKHEWKYGVGLDGTTQLLVESGTQPPEAEGAGAPSR